MILFNLIAIFTTLIMPGIVSAQLDNILTCDRLIISGLTDCLKKYPASKDKNPCW